MDSFTGAGQINYLEVADLPWRKRPPFEPAPKNDAFVFSLSSKPPQVIASSELAKLLNREMLLHRTFNAPAARLLMKRSDRVLVSEAIVLALLSVELFVRKRGKLPKSIEECVPENIIDLVADTYSLTGESVILRVADDCCLVYSLGTDGIDDGYTGTVSEYESALHITELSNSHNFEGFRIPLQRPVLHEVQSSLPDNVQD